ncbi:double-strand break repair protein AddB [Lutimaribacter marinistellae]|uniref:Double-strand break repair protein AddB n=1 Tax=Lutimaribacter marinistellae TaxID=1820329 RepID=A0ABV7TCT7_9RHOB
MFDPQDRPRVFALPPGADFGRDLVEGLRCRLKGFEPDAIARVELIVNTTRMRRRIRTLFDQGPPGFLPRIRLLTEVGDPRDMAGLPPAIPPLRRRLQLAQLIGKLLDTQPDLAARSSTYDLADSLALLIEEMAGEGVSYDAISTLDVSDLSGHWERAQRFIGIAEQYLATDGGALDAQARQRLVVERLIARWSDSPPAHPVILAGSTGSRGTTMMLMEAVARLPQGAVILPGFDFDLPAQVWSGMDDALLCEDHPQFRFRKLMRALDLSPEGVGRWTDNAAPAADRNRVVSLSLRPAPVTDAWMEEGPHLHDIQAAMEQVTLVEARSPREEALSIALRLRKAAEEGQTAALITPDRMLTRQVAAALDRWRILPDDSAGLPLHLSPPGRFLRHVAELFANRLDGQALLTLLKHPLTHSGSDRGDHLRHTRDLELDLRRNGPPFPEPDSLSLAAERKSLPQPWLDWLTSTFCDQTADADRPLGDWVLQLRTLAELIAQGSEGQGSGALWDKKAGQSALKVVEALAHEADHGGDMSARDFCSLLGALLSGEEVRDRDAPHPGIMIWGTLEARVMGADLLILGGLNEGSWPEAPSPDPWLNRQMRDRAGLLLPERRIGLSAHDYQQAIGAREVWLTRAERSEDAETVASRWLNRLTNLLQGLPEQGGTAALADMRARGRVWTGWAAALEEATRTDPAHRPSPRPPITARPKRLSVTEIKRLIRDPYAIYAKHVLRLRPLDPLVQAPDALLRGIVVHEILETFIRDSVNDPALLAREGFLDRAAALLERHVAWPGARKLWLARLGRIADDFLAAENGRRMDGVPVAFEAKLKQTLAPLDFTLVGRADRLDRTTRGSLRIYDYKTGTPPSVKEQHHFDKQLLIEAAMAEEGGFADLGPAPVAEAVFIGMGGTYKEVAAPLADDPPDKVLADLRKLISAYLDPDQGYTARRMLQRDSLIGDYDQLARYGEWDRTATPVPEELE